MNWLYSTSTTFFSRKNLLSSGGILKNPPITTFILFYKNFSSKNNYKILKDLNINIKKINLLHEKLDEINDIEYKFDDFYYYPPNYINNKLSWIINLKNLINKVLKDNLIYSLVVLGYSEEKRTTITYGPHILITKKIIIKHLITYIQGKIDSSILDLESGCDEDDVIIFFKYRAISINKKIFNSVSKLNYNIELSKKDNSIELLNKKYYKKILYFINKIPLSYKIEDFGSLITNFNKLIDFKIGNHFYINGSLYNYSKDTKIFIYDKNEYSQKGIVYIKDIEYFRFKDILFNNKINKYENENENFIIKNFTNTSNIDFIRIINDNYIAIKDFNIICIESIMKGKLIQKMNKDSNQNLKIGSFDLECFRDKNNVFTPYACQWMINNINKTYYLTDFKNLEEMLENCFIEMFTHCIGYTIYAHNLSSFDGLLVIKTIYKLFRVKPFFKDNKIMNFEISKNKQKFILRCSLVLLPISLKKLIKSFNLNILKLPYPYEFIKKNKLNYIGSIPKFKYFNENHDYKNNIENIFNIKDYLNLAKKYINNNWNLKMETIKYLNNDVESLYNIISKFNYEFFNLENINITKSISISSLALKTFLTNYYNDEKTPIFIPQYSQYNDIRNAYYGGRVEVFGSYAENIHWYDINSLYPYAMLKDMPTGYLVKSTDNDLDNYFGYCYATVKVSDNIKNPPLPFRFNGLLYYPTGEWTTWYSSEILKYVKDNYDINVVIHHGYKYTRTSNLFNNYVYNYYNLKKQNDNNEGRRFIAKLMLNSLYGRFGLKYISSITEIVNSKKAKEISLKYQVIANEIFDKTKKLEFIKYNIIPNEYLYHIDENFYNDIKIIGEKNSNNIIRSVGIAAMITSQASIYMDKFLNLPDNKCFYTDTDSGFFERMLDPKYVGNNIGQFKYLGLIKKGYFIAPKLYCLVMDDGRTIIKSKGIPSKYLTEQDFIKMLKGKSKIFNIKKFKKDFKNFKISYEKSKLEINPNNQKRIPIYNNKNISIDSKPFKVINNTILNIKQ